MRKLILLTVAIAILIFFAAPSAFSFFGGKFKKIEPENGKLRIPLEEINDGKAHYFKTKSADGTIVSFFTIKSKDGVIRAAIDACDVCYRAGKGYVQKGDNMVCENCGMKFPSNKINDVKGGCNPAPLERVIKDEYLVIWMTDINKNSWYCKHKDL